eukprot:COSAG04_NODE_762_length_10515_cov_9.807508_2_plen_92_part_00
MMNRHSGVPQLDSRSLLGQVEPYGLCKVIPPAGWAPSWPIDSDNFRFATRIQNVHQLQERGEFAFWKQLKESLAKQVRANTKTLTSLRGDN